MTAEAALYSYFNSYGIPFYEENSVEKDASFPYGTYNVVTDELGNQVALNISLWYRTETWLDINKKAREIYKRIGLAGAFIDYEEGVIWLTRGSPFAQSMGDPNDDLIKRKLINITAEFLTAY